MIEATDDHQSWRGGVGTVADSGAQTPPQQQDAGQMSLLLTVYTHRDSVCVCVRACVYASALPQSVKGKVTAAVRGECRARCLA